MKIFIITALVSLSLFINNPVFPYGYNCVTTSDGLRVIAAGNNGIISRSFDSGLSWNTIFVSEVNFKSISSANNNTYLTADNNKIYRISTNFNSSVTTFSVAGNFQFNSVCFVSDSTGYICGSEGSVYITTNAGVNWTMRNTGIPPVKLNSISFKDVNNGVVAGDSGNIYVTTNGGINWSKQNIGTDKNLLKTKYFNDGIIVTGEYGSLFKNITGLWQEINTRTVSDITGITGSSVSEIHICGGGGFIRNNLNNNTDFTNFEPNPMMDNLVDISYFQSKGYAVSSLNTALIKTINEGHSWQFVPGVQATYSWERKLNKSSVAGNTLCRHPSNRNTFFCGIAEDIFVSRNNGDSWDSIASVPDGGMHSFYVSPLDTNVWMAAVEGNQDKVIRSTNYGQTWTTSITRNISTYGQPLELDQNNPSVYYFAPDGGGFYKSVDDGITFDLISNFPFQSPCDIIVTWNNSQIIYVGDGPTNGSGAKIYRSTNGGINWNISLDILSSEIPSMSNSVFEENIVYATTVDNEFYKTSDFGDTWSPIFTLQSANWASAVCEEDPNLIFNGLYSGRCYFSLDKGSNWTFSSGAIYGGLGLLAPAKDVILYYEILGINKLKVNYTGIVSVNGNAQITNIPQDFLLSQNYPNPFNPKTVIRYKCSMSNDVSLRVFNLLGNEVAELVNEKQNAGSYSVEFDGSSYASGIYFYSLYLNGSLFETKRMVLLK